MFSRDNQGHSLDLYSVDFTSSFTLGVSVEIDMSAQKVYVSSSLPSEELLAVIKKTGRECSYVGVKQ